MKNIILILSIMACAMVTSCATDPSSQDLKSPCVSADHSYSPCIRKPVANDIA